MHGHEQRATEECDLLRSEHIVARVQHHNTSSPKGLEKFIQNPNMLIVATMPADSLTLPKRGPNAVMEEAWKLQPHALSSPDGYLLTAGSNKRETSETQQMNKFNAVQLATAGLKRASQTAITACI